MNPEVRMVVALDRSAGNETVGEAWQDTAVFSEKATLMDVLEWACDAQVGYLRKDYPDRDKVRRFRGHLSITIAQEPETRGRQ